MSDRLAAVIGGTGILGTLTVEHFNAILGTCIALLTIGILFPKFLSAIPRTVAILRKGYSRFAEETEKEKPDRDLEQ